MDAGLSWGGGFSARETFRSRVQTTRLATNLFSTLAISVWHGKPASAARARIPASTNWTPIVEGILSQARAVDADLSEGLFFATCNEDVPFLDEKEIVAQTRGTFLGAYRVRQQQATCKSWPKTALPIACRQPVRSSLPTMFVSGDIDGATPLWFMEHAATGFTERIEIVARGQGHTECSDYIAQHYKRFVISGSTHEAGAASCEPVPRPPFKID